MQPAIRLGSAWLLVACTTPPENAELLRAIFEMQDQRVRDIGPLERHLRHRDPTVRRFAVRALGAQRHTRSIPGLLRALRDHDRGVQRAAIFALGRQPGNDRWPRLERYADLADPELCATVLASLRTADLTALPHLPRLLLQSDGRIAGQAALAMLRLRGDRLRGESLRNESLQFDSTALASLRDLFATALSLHRDTPTRWRLTYALAHLVIPSALETLRALATNEREGRFTRLFAIRGLGALPPLGGLVDAQITHTLLALARDPDAKLCWAAIAALGRPHGETDPRPRLVDHRTCTTLLTLARHENPHVRVQAIRALAEFEGHAPVIEASLSTARFRDGATRAALLETRSRLVGRSFRPRLTDALRSDAWQLRAATANAAAILDWPAAKGLLTPLCVDRDRRVQIAALHALGHFAGESRATEITIARLHTADLAIRETASDTLLALRDATAIPALVQAYQDSLGPGLDLAFAEARVHLLRATTALGAATPHTIALLDAARHDPTRFVRQAAAALLRAANRPSTIDQTPDHRETPVLGVALSWDFLATRPVIEVTTTKGSFEITLRPDKAPIHCFNLLQLIASGTYRGRLFHRVVPNFVVQGGAHRIDGFGNTAYHGGRLRDEINDLPFLAGMVGMPKSEYPDTGGDQLFVTTVPTPHLDRRYTVFGRVTRGLDVLDRIEIGDSIDDISILRH